MAVAILMDWQEASTADYDAVQERLGLDVDTPPGGILHIVGDYNGSLRVIDVWESVEEFNDFVERRLRPAIEDLGLQDEPEIYIYPLHNLWAPSPERIDELGSKSLAR